MRRTVHEQQEAKDRRCVEDDNIILSVEVAFHDLTCDLWD